jgi:ABC-type transport system involved in multi-copper enzyme maturation permease subunit
MTWLAWRQFRLPVLSVFAALAAVGVVLLITGPDLVGETNFSDQEFPYSAGLLLLYALPAVIGVFWGVPLVTRELETGTHNLVWNQTVTRKRWLATKVGMGALAAMVAAGLLSLAVSWWASPIDAMAASDDGQFESRMSPVVFAARGIVPIGYAAFAFVLGIAVGILLRRTVAAMAVTLVVFAAVQVAVPLVVRPYILPPTEETVTITEESIRGMQAQEVGGRLVSEAITVAHPAGSWVLTDETIGPDGNAVFPLPSAVSDCFGPAPTPGVGPGQDIVETRTCLAQLDDLGYHQQLTYQPASRFWPLQWVELGFFLALSALLTWFCFRRIRHVS